MDEVQASAYGSKGQSWSGEFIQYMEFIANHPVYEGMPDTKKPDGKIQWEAPSNRNAGRFKDTHHKRRDWWRSKAVNVGVSETEPHWISKVAKRIHPTGQKPCKRCGRVLQLAYVYPSANCLQLLNAKFGSTLQCDGLTDIREYATNLYELAGLDALNALGKALSGKNGRTRDFENLENSIQWINDNLVKKESRLLSPGAMSNAPDRFDGFHSFNRCCRGSADTGRNPQNLKQYTTDRRAFEYWSGGNWVAADRMMSFVKTVFAQEPCADGGQPPASPDHIGPVSLGFEHRPCFRLLSRSANSAKNNRMTLKDVNDLVEAEASGESVISWFAKELWDILKLSVRTDEEALRLSKILRDHHRHAMIVFARASEEGHALFLTTFLQLQNADFDYNFSNIRVDNFITRFDSLVPEKRKTKYAAEQRARRLRVAFDSLRGYQERDNRHTPALDPDKLRELFEMLAPVLTLKDSNAIELNKTLASLASGVQSLSEATLREISGDVEKYANFACFAKAKSHIGDYLAKASRDLAELWDDERYVRTESRNLV